MQIHKIIHESWHEYLQPLFDDIKMQKIKDNVLPKCKFYPESGDIFKVFRMPIDKIRVILIGQDPYFNGSATGLAFATKSNFSMPKSLSIIQNEIIRSKAELDLSTPITSPMWRTLEHWERQGVFLLNTALTVEAGKPEEHLGQWMWFTREVIKAIGNHHPGIIWVLWGAKARAFKDYIVTGNENWVKVIVGNHPAAESYSKDTKYPFTGCNHFNIINQYLESIEEHSSINW